MAATTRTHWNASAQDPAVHAAAVTPSDSVDLANTSTALYIGGTGNLTVIMLGGEQVTFAAVPVGILPIRVTRVLSTGTAATNILALWRES